MGDKCVFFHHVWDDHGCFNNWYHAPFEYGARTYVSVEQFVFYHKAAMARRIDLCMQCEAAKNPDTLLRLERVVGDSLDSDLWKSHKYTIMKRAVRAKFEQNRKLMLHLFETENSVLALCSTTDLELSIGVSITDKARLDRKQWKGENKLGQILMQVRGELSMPQKPSYENASFKAFPTWQKRPCELFENVAHFNAIMTYADMIENKALKRRFLFINTLLDTEDKLVNFKDGGLPRYGFTEMKQELFDNERLKI